MFRRVVVVALAASPLFDLTDTATASLQYNHELPECEQDTEVQFYTATLDVLNLPETCYDGIHLGSIGFIIQDIVDDVEDEMPEYQEERSDTMVCPFPDEVTGERRRLSRKKRYRYKASGRCKRCKKSNTDRRLQLSTSTVCSIAKSILHLRDEVEYHATAAMAVLDTIKAKIDENDSLDEDYVHDLLDRAVVSYQNIQKQRKVNTDASDIAKKLCVSSSGTESSTSNLVDELEAENQTAQSAACESGEALAGMRGVLRELNTAINIQSMEPRLDPAVQESRELQKDEICGYEQDAEKQKDEAKDLCEQSESIRDDIKDIARNVDMTKAWDAYNEADKKVDDCEDQVKVIDRARGELKSLCRKAKRKRYSSSRFRAAQGRANDAYSAITKAKVYHAEIKAYHDELSKPSPTPDPTLSPTPAPTPSPIEVTTVPEMETGAGETQPENRPSGEQEYIDRLTANLDASNTACEKVKEAMVQKTLAEETAIHGDMVYDEVMKLAIGHEGNADVERIKQEAQVKHERIQNEAAKACAAADLASQICQQSRTRSLRNLAEENASVLEELVASVSSVVESRLSLSDEKTAREEMDEVLALIEFDPVMSELQAAIKEDEALLKLHKDDVESEISQVDSQIQSLPNSSPETSALVKKKDSLVVEESQIDDALVNEEKFVISQSALKKDQLYESKAPDFNKSPPLQYILRSRQSNLGVSVVEKNWNVEDETEGSKEEWFARFSEKLAVEVPRRLKLQYSKSDGGCITVDAELELDMVVTELKSVWEYLDPPPCFPNLDLYSPTQAPVAVPTPAPIPAAPTTCNVDESKASACASVRQSNRCRDAIDYWYRETSNEEMACARVAFEGEDDCGACLPPTMTGVDLCGTSACTDSVLYTRSSAGGTCGSGILYYVMQENLLQDLACKSVAVEQSGCRPCLPPQPNPVCTATCTDAVLNTRYNGNGDTCGSGIAYWLRREPEEDACSRVANEQSHVCGCCHPDASKRPNNC